MGRPRVKRCKRGHPLSGRGADVLIRIRNGREVRDCRKCARERERDRYWKDKRELEEEAAKFWGAAV